MGARVDTLVDERVRQGHGGAPALVLDDGQVLSYAALAERIAQAALDLAALGLRRGERMVLVGENSVHMVIALFACLRLGAWAVPLNARMSPGEVDAICSHCEPRLVFFDAAASPAAAAHADHASRASQPSQASDPSQAAHSPGCFTLPAFEAGRFARHLGDGPCAVPEAATRLADVAVMVYTSGSTGAPKGVMLTHANLRFITDVSLQQEVLLPADVMFHALPISHSFGLVSGLMCSLRAGACLHLVPRFSAEALADAISAGRITVFQGVPAMYARLHEWAVQTGRGLQPNRLRMIYIGGSLIDAARKAQTEALLGLRLHHGYGLTEAAPAVARTFGHPAPQDVTAGWPIPGIEVQVQGEGGQPLAPGERGEICVRGPNVMAGYFRDAAQTAEAIDEQGWLRTGDVGVFSPAGDLSIVGRRKELIIRSGFNVYPAEVEKAIADFAGIAQCAVVGRQHAGDEEIVAYVEPVAGHTVDTAALDAFLRQRLAPYKLPRHIRVLDVLPASSTGKVLKAELARRAQHELDALVRPGSDLSRLLAPAAVAVVGASDNPHKVGGRPIAYLTKQGYQGRVYPVNPKVAAVQGIPAYASLADLPEVPDAVVLCVGAEQAEEQLALCAQRGVPHVLVFAASYAEVGLEGRQRQERLLEICRRGGVRLVGPNTIGVASFDSRAILSFASIYSDHEPLDGPVAIVSQSGAFGVTAYAHLRSVGWGVRCVAATGNEADLDSADFIHALVRSADVKLVLLYVEHVSDPARMAAALDAASARGVAVVAVRAGRALDGRRSAELHTGSPGAGTAALDTLFAERGCRTVRSLDDMVASVPLYLGPPAARRPDPRLALISNSGASCVLAADEAAVQGLPLAALNDATRAALAAVLPTFSLNRNPIDLTAMLLTDASLLGRVVDLALADVGVDAVVLALLAIGGPSYDVPRFVRETVDAACRHRKPLVLCSPHVHVRDAFAAAGMAVFASEAAALAALRDFWVHATALGGGSAARSFAGQP